MTLRRLLATAVLLHMLGGLTACSGPSFGRSASDRAHFYESTTASEWRMAKDDFDHFWMMERRSRLTRWH